jgi:hypothetical protein
LFGRAAVDQVCADVPPQPGIQKFARSPWLSRPSGRLRVSGAGPIGMPLRGGTGCLAPEGAGSSPQYSRHRPYRMAKGQPQPQAQRLSFFMT